MQTVSFADLSGVTVEEALALAESGFHIGPLTGKIPAVSGGFRSFTQDANRIAQWFSTGMYNVGGWFPGLIVIDCDPRNGFDPSSIDLPMSLTSISGRGDGGFHRFYALPQGVPVLRSRIPELPGVDLKDWRRGYVVLPPSRHPETRQKYTWDHHPVTVMPAELIERFGIAHQETYGSSWDAPDGLEPDWLADFVRQAQAGNRNNAFHWALNRAVDCGHASMFPTLCEAAHLNGLNPDEILQTVASVKKKRGIS